MSYALTPRTRLFLLQTNGTGPTSKITGINEVKSLLSLSGGLTTDTTYGTLTATWADSDYTTFASSSTRPKPMVLVHLVYYDSANKPWPLWTGYADSITRTVNFGQSTTFTLQASDPYKLFDVGLQTPQAANQLNYDYAFGVTGTGLLVLAANQVNYPGALGGLPKALGWNYSLALNARGQPGTIDYTADAGINTWGAWNQNFMISPAQQTWSAVLQNVLANTEIECFFNEQGQCIWRPLAYLNVPVNRAGTPDVVTVQKDRILNHAWTETDIGVVTDIYVRWGALQAAYNQGSWHAPSTMRSALGSRGLVVFAPWILSTAGASALATALGLRYSGNMHTCELTALTDPTIRIGTTIRVPKFPDMRPVDPTNTHNGAISTGLGIGTGPTTPFYFYYVYALQYSWQVGGQFTTNYDLRYGRDETLQLPYFGSSSYFADSNPYSHVGGTATPDTTILLVTSPDLSNPGKLTNTFSLAVNDALTPKYINMDPSIAGPGSVILLRDASGRQLGSYIVAGKSDPGYQAVTGFILQTASTTGLPAKVSVTITSYGPAPTDAAGINTASGGTSSSSGGNSASGGNAANPGGAAQKPGSSQPGSVVVQGSAGTLPGQGAAGLVVYWPVNSGPNTIDHQPFGPTTNTYEWRYPYQGYPGPYYAHFHTGMDLDAHYETVYAPANGVVVSSTPTSPFSSGNTAFSSPNVGAWFNAGWGNCIILQSGPLFILFAHLSALKVTVGQAVSAGQPIATSGDSGNSGGPHLHFGIYDSSLAATAVDPRWTGYTGVFRDPAPILAQAGPLPTSPYYKPNQGGK